MAKRPIVLRALNKMPGFLLKPEVMGLLEAEKDPQYRLLFDLMWSTGARVSAVLALTPSSSIDDGYDFGAILKTLKQ